MKCDDLLDRVADIARGGGAEAMAVYASEIAVQNKDDKSPVTEADRRAEAVILERLAELTPDIPVISEEEASAGRIPDVDARFWLVDPLDGTKEFIRRNGEFTINIALVENGRPVLGVVYAQRWSACSPVLRTWARAGGCCRLPSNHVSLCSRGGSNSRRQPFAQG